MTVNHEYAVWIGRFQPIHNGHIQILQVSLTTLAQPHLVVLPYWFHAEHQQSQYALEAGAVYAEDRNPLTAWERRLLVEQAISALPEHARISVTSCPHHLAFPKVLEEVIPAERTICLTDKNDFEHAKKTYWLERGESVSLITVPPGVLTTTAIRLRVLKGEAWQLFLPPTTHELFEQMDGPRRVFGV